MTCILNSNIFLVNAETNKEESIQNIKVNNLHFKNVDYRMCMGETYAFVTCIDKMQSGQGTHEKKYWGPVAERNDPTEIKHIMEYGAKWDNLP